jgi:hypothetical protein
MSHVNGSVNKMRVEGRVACEVGQVVLQISRQNVTQMTDIITDQARDNMCAEGGIACEVGQVLLQASDRNDSSCNTR